MKAMLARLNTIGLFNGINGDKKLSLRQFIKKKPLIAWLLVVAIFTVGYFRVLEPAFDYCANSEKKTQRIYMTISKHEVLLARAQNKLASLSKTREDYLSLATPPQNAAGDKRLISIIHQAAKSVGLDQIQVSAMNSQKKSSLTRKLFQLTAKGSQTQIIAFIQGLPAKPQKLFVTEVDLTAVDTNVSGNLSVKVIVDTYHIDEPRQ